MHCPEAKVFALGPAAAIIVLQMGTAAVESSLQAQNINGHPLSDEVHKHQIKVVRYGCLLQKEGIFRYLS